jgi:predicted signal transduction protein with EAL and GGDEF domain
MPDTIDATPHTMALTAPASQCSPSEADASRGDDATALPSAADGWFGQSAALIDQARIDGSIVALMVLDIEEIGQVGARLGAAAKESILHTLALRLADLASSKIVVTRYAQNRFLIVAGDLKVAVEAHDLAYHIGDLVAPPIPVNGCDVTLAPIIGLSFFPDHAPNFPQLLERADALNRATRTAAVAILPVLR